MRRFRTILALATLACPALLAAQQKAAAGPRTDLVVTYTTERALRTTSGQSFWKQGVSFSFGSDLWKGFGPAFDLTVGHAGSIANSGVKLTTLSATVGPRYRWHPQSRISPFGEALVGLTHGSNSLFPTASGAKFSTTNLGVLVDAGLDVRMGQHFVVRAPQIGWVHSALPNGADNVQNNLRLSFGAGIRF